MKPRHIGIIACSYEGAALCYRTVCNEGSIFLGEHAHPEVSLHTLPLSDYMAYIGQDDWGGVASLMNTSAQKLCSIGAEILICPDNTIHRVYKQASEGIPKPWLHIAEEVAKVASDKAYAKIGILGTQYLMESEVYPDALGRFGMDFMVPELEHRVRINRIIFEELVYGQIRETSKNYFLELIQELKGKGCDAVVLGCTEIPLIVFPDESALPTLDSTRLLARAALLESIA